jgi:hypothetical protein
MGKVTKLISDSLLLTIAAGFMMGCPPTTPTPAISPGTLTPPTQPFACPNVITLSDANPAATIYYSTAGMPMPGHTGTFTYNGSGGTGPFQVNGVGLTTLTAMATSPGLNESPDATATFSCPSGSPPTFDTIDIQIQTGNDNADQNLEILGILNSPRVFLGNLCLKPSNDSSVPSGPSGPGGWTLCANGASDAPSWGNGNVFDTGHIPLPTPLTPAQVAAGNLQIQSNQSPCGFSCSNWDIQTITVTFFDSTNTLPPDTAVTFGPPISSGWNSNNCLARLKTPFNATTVQFSLNGTEQHTYVDGTSSEAGAVTTCTDNGDGGVPPA